MKRILFAFSLIWLAACQPLSAPSLPAKTPAGSPLAAQTEVPQPTTEEAQAPTQGPSSPGPLQSAGTLPILELAVRDLARRVDADLNEIEVLSILAVEWPSSGLGCEIPGQDYVQEITPGYRILLGHEGEAYLYHTDAGQFYFLCQDGQPQFPLILVDPDEIQDGIPWMPVDPVPTVDPGSTIADPDPVK